MIQPSFRIFVFEQVKDMFCLIFGIIFFLELQYSPIKRFIMEESQIVDNFAILLYSRTYQTLFLQILNTENQNVISKHVIKTSDFVTIELGTPLCDIQMMVFKSEQNMQILDEFKFQLEDFNTASTVEQKSNYVKLKKRFPHYSLLLQIFYQSQSSINSCNNLDEQDEKEAMRLTLEQNKKQKLNEIKAMAKANMVLLGMKIINGLYRRKKKCNTAIPSEGSLDRRMNRKNTKYRTVFVDDNNNFHQFKKRNYSQTNLQRQAEVISSKDISKQISIQNQCDQDFDVKDKPIKSYKREFPRKKNNKHLNPDITSSQNSAQVRKVKKKTTLENDILSIKDLSQNRNDYRLRQASSIHNKKSIGDKPEPIKTMKRVNIAHQKKQYYCTLDHSRVDKVNDNFPAGNYPISNFFAEKTSNCNMVIRRLKNLCQQRSQEKINIKKLNSPKLKQNLTLEKQVGRKTIDKSIQDLPKIQRKPKELRRKTYIPPKTHESHDLFYHNLYNKTMNSIERQKQILNFVQSECNTNDFLPQSNMSMALLKSHKMLQNVRMTNMSTETHETIQNTNGQCKLKKITSQGQLYRVYKIYADKTNKRKLRS